MLEGNLGKRPLNENEPEPEREDYYRCPGHLEGDARDEWHRLEPILSRAGVLTTADLGVLELYCETWAEWRQARRLIRQHGLLLERSNGRLQANPAAGIANRALIQLKGLAAELGLSPASRSRLAIEPDEPFDPSEELLNGNWDPNPR